METTEEKIFFRPGDCVTLRLHKVMHSPVMLVLRREASLFKDNLNIKGLRCRWFTDSGLMLEACFNTKDLVRVDLE